jgi:hypothetical protein
VTDLEEPAARLHRSPLEPRLYAHTKPGEPQLSPTSSIRLHLESAIGKIQQALRHPDALTTAERAELNQAIAIINGVEERQARRGAVGNVVKIMAAGDPQF